MQTGQSRVRIVKIIDIINNINIKIATKTNLKQPLRLIHSATKAHNRQKIETVPANMLNNRTVVPIEPNIQNEENGQKDSKYNVHE